MIVFAVFGALAGWLFADPLALVVEELCIAATTEVSPAAALIASGSDLAGVHQTIHDFFAVGTAAIIPAALNPGVEEGLLLLGEGGGLDVVAAATDRFDPGCGVLARREQVAFAFFETRAAASARARSFHPDGALGVDAAFVAAGGIDEIVAV